MTRAIRTKANSSSRMTRWARGPRMSSIAIPICLRRSMSVTGSIIALSATVCRCSRPATSKLCGSALPLAALLIHMTSRPQVLFLKCVPFCRWTYRMRTTERTIVGTWLMFPLTHTLLITSAPQPTHCWWVRRVPPFGERPLRSNVAINCQRPPFISGRQ